MTDATILTLDEMLDADDLVYHTEVVPEWKRKDGSPGSVRLASLDAGTMLEFLEKPATEPAGPWLLVQALVDAEGTRIGTPEAVVRMLKKNKSVVTRLIDVVLAMNGMGGPPAVAKNDSGDVAPAAPPIASPSPSAA